MIENRVRRLRKVRGLTQQDLARLVGVSRQTINAIENGRYEPSLPLAFDVARVFSTRIEDVFRPSRRGHGVETSWKELIMNIPTILDGDTVRLRPHRRADLPAFERFVTDPRATRYMAFTDEQETPEGAAALMDMVIDSYTSDDPILSLTVADPATDAYLGSVGAADSGDGTAEMFVTLLPEAQGNGYATAAVDVLVGHLFDRCGTTEVHADVVRENESSIRVFERAGFRLLGPIERVAEGGELAHRAITGVRYTLTAARYRAGRSR